MNAASRAAAIDTMAKELFKEDPEVYEACAEWFEFRERFNNQDEALLDRLKFLAQLAKSKAMESIDNDDRFGDPNE